MNESTYIMTLSKFKANTFEFEMETDGISLQEANVSFIIESSAMNLMFEANKIDGKKWEVIIPPLPILQKTMYPFRIALESEGYYFEPMIGAVNVVGEGKVTVTPSADIRMKEVRKIGETIDAIDPSKMNLTPKSAPRKTSVPEIHPLLEKEEMKVLPDDALVDKIIKEKKSKSKKIITEQKKKPSINKNGKNPLTNLSMIKEVFGVKPANESEEIIIEETIEIPSTEKNDKAVANILREMKKGKMDEKFDSAVKDGGMLSGFFEEGKVSLTH